MSIVFMFAVLCLIEAKQCAKRAKIWDAIADLEQRIEDIKRGKK